MVMMSIVEFREVHVAAVAAPNHSQNAVAILVGYCVVGDRRYIFRS